MIGPFIKDDPSLAPMHSEFPDHGLDSLPSFNYMNRDKLNLKEEFISLDTVISLIEKEELENQPFDVQTIFPEGFKINLNKCFVGRGERSIYLYSKLNADEAISKWLMMGCSAYFKVFQNDSMIYQANEIIRSWPYAHFTKIDLKKGINHLLIKIDTPTDYFDFEIGLKEFVGKHPHQSEWETGLIFNAEN